MWESAGLRLHPDPAEASSRSCCQGREWEHPREENTGRRREKHRRAMAEADRKGCCPRMGMWFVSHHGHRTGIPAWPHGWCPTMGIGLASYYRLMVWARGYMAGSSSCALWWAHHVPHHVGWHPTASVLAFTVWLLRVLIFTAFWETHSAGKEFGQKHEGSSAPLLLELPPGAALSSGQHLAAPAVDPSLLPQPFPCTVTTR